MRASASSVAWHQCMTVHALCRHPKGVSGFRRRRLSANGRKVLKRRRKKGRKLICPASARARKNGKKRV